ncbi:NarK family nitrate/nitrite MFS transporter [Methylophaga sp. OBS4]|uniref:nitrate/nitrite transporter n=1 Tax=Methylophaga sp. OBS4 TaxID=2991935 RepID=UPI002B1CD693|nr:NarK family nitrate/nitrite MFS transporter [Methylophaga sp. OBS4]
MFCFAAWTVLSVIGIQIRDQLGLVNTQLALLMAMPVLTGALSRLVFGVMADYLGGRRIFILLMLIPAGFLWLFSISESYVAMLLSAAGFGLLGGSFVVGAGYTTSWFKQSEQARALAIIGSATMGMAMTSFGTAVLLQVLSWQQMIQLTALTLVVVAIVFQLMAHPEPGRSELRKQLISRLTPISEPTVWRFSFYYFLLFGGFIALVLWLPVYLIEVYRLNLVQAGAVTAIFIVVTSLMHIPAISLVSKLGARRSMYASFGVVMLSAFVLSYPPTTYLIHGVSASYQFAFSINLLIFTLLICVLGSFLSLGNVAVLKHIPDYFPNHIGLVVGTVAMIGGLGGFLLPLTFGLISDVVGVWQVSFMLLFVMAAVSLLWMHFTIRRAEQIEWRQDQEVSDLPELSTPSVFVLEDWRPEDQAFWQQKGKRIARRNLWISIPCLFLAFAVWTIWSILVVKMPELGFAYSANQLFWLAALPALSGATLRLFYGFMVPVFGGRRWTALSTASLLIPCIWLSLTLQNPETPYVVMLILALLCGFGGGNFSSSMANISFFFPKKEKGTALGLNAGLGNVGVAAMQLIGPLIISSSVLGGEPLTVASGAQAGSALWLQNAALIWVPLIAVAAIAAWFGMNDIASAKSSFSEQAVIFKRFDNWTMCVLYLGTFGSFIGFAAGFPLLSGKLFPDVDVMKYAFIGPLIGALARPVGGMLADKLSGAIVTFWLFVIMVMGVIGVILFLPTVESEGNFAGFFIMFLLLFLASGAGNGSTFRMVPVICLTLRHEALGESKQEQAVVEANRESAAILGFISAIAAYGGFFIPKSYGTALSMTGDVRAAFIGFVVFYVVCLFITFYFYMGSRARVKC